jgi:hypothetical protein
VEHNNAKWRATMQEEMKALHKNNTWDLVQLPNGKKVDAGGCSPSSIRPMVLWNNTRPN